MPRVEQYTIHCREASSVERLFPQGLCGKTISVVDLLVGPEEFHRRAGGVCKACADSVAWKRMQMRIVAKEGS